jgi:bifunctional aspartokinase / homoserine dehydrogenase 1
MYQSINTPHTGSFSSNSFVPIYQNLHHESTKNHKVIHLALLGKGQVGKALIDQITSNQAKILSRKNIHLKIFAIANSQGIWLDANGLQSDWETQSPFTLAPNDQARKVVEFAKEEHLENLILIDNTASKAVALQYEYFAENGFDLISSNKIHNTLSLEQYRSLRKKLQQHSKNYLYETNVGAGLPLIDNIKLLHLSGDNILKIKGVFSGSLSYIFNTFSESAIPFSDMVLKAKDLGFTEPDPREDLCGQDVARKLLILARELDFEMELTDVQVENLIPESLRALNQTDFFNRLEEMNPIYEKIKSTQQDQYVLRYLGELEWNQVLEQGSLAVKLVSVPKSSTLGRVSGSDSIFEIYTESYGQNPVIIQGAGAGAQVTARGVFGDILKISEIKN